MVGRDREQLLRGLLSKPVADVDERGDDDDAARAAPGTTEPAVIDERVAARTGKGRARDEPCEERDRRGDDGARDRERDAARARVETRAAIGQRGALLREQEARDARAERERG